MRSAARRIGVVSVLLLAGCTVTTRVSVSQNDVEGNGPSADPALSAGGRYVAFSSEASNLVPNDTNGRSDAFVRDTVERTTERVSLTDAGQQIAGDSVADGISDDGRYVLFSSALTETGTDLDTFQVFLRDRTARTTTLVSRRDDGAPANGDSFGHALSPDGRFVLFSSTASDLPGDASTEPSLFRFDRTTANVTLVASPGACAPAGTTALEDAITDADQAWATGAVAYTHECATSSGGNTAVLIVVVPGKAPTTLAAIEAQRALLHLDFARDGSVLAWTEQTTSFRGGEDVAELKLWTGSGQPQSVVVPTGAFDVAVNGNGRYLALTTKDRESSHYTGLMRVAVLDRSTGEWAVASTNLAGRTPEPGDDDVPIEASVQPVLDDAGTTVGFTSYLHDIVLNDRNHAPDVFARPLSSMFGSGSAGAARSVSRPGR
jgi:hypothetical protein